MLPVRDSQMDKVPAKETNLMYYGSENTKRSKIDTYQSTNYTFDINSKTSQSVGTVIITPQAGLSHLWVGVRLPVQQLGPTQTYAGLALPTGWGFSLIQSMTFRYGSSAPFSLSGNALRIAACVNAGNAGEKEQLMSAFGGQACADDEIDGDNLYAYIPLTLAHCSSESGTEVRAPFPTDMLNGPITIDIQWADFRTVFAKATGATGNIPSALAEAWIGTRQIIPIYSDDKMVLKSGQVYNYPIKFYQPPNAIPLSKQSTNQTVNLVGVKSGQCQGIYTWVVKSGGATPEVAKANQNIFVPLKDVKMTYAGTVLQYMRGNGAAAAFMDTLFQDCPSYFTAAKLALNQAGTDWDTTAVAPTVSYFQHFPFIQRFEQLSDSCLLQNGVRVDSGSIQLDLAINDPDFDETANYTLYYMPWFSAALSLDAGGGCNYLF